MAWTRRKRAGLLALVIGSCVATGCAAETENGRGSGNNSGGGAGAAGGSAQAGDGAASGGSGSSGSSGQAGTKDTDADDDCPSVSQTADNKVQPVDIIIAIDTSGSMGEEIGFVQSEMNAFSQQIIDSGIDAHVVLLGSETSGDGMSNCVVFWPGTPCVSIGGSSYGVCIDAPIGSGVCPADSNLPTYAHVSQEIGSTDALQKILESYPNWKSHLREASAKQFLIITDDNADGFLGGADPMVTAQSFVEQVRALDMNPLMFSDFRVNAIYCFTLCGGTAASIGTVYDLLVPQTGGTRGDLCLQDFKPVFDDIAKQVTSSVKVTCEWDIPAVPAGKTFDRGKTNVKVTLGGAEEIIGNLKLATDCADRQAWYYDVSDQTMAPSKVLACPALCQRIQGAPDAKVDVLFDCPTIPVVVD